MDSQQQKSQKQCENRQNDLIVVHGTKFNPLISNESLQKFSQFAAEQSDQKWQLDQNQYSRLNAQTFFTHMVECPAQQLFLNQNNLPNILRDISSIIFSRLKILGLSQNRIQSIQLLTGIQMPMLQGINLYDNCLTSIKPLSRAQFPHLFVISLEDNFITDFSPIARMPYQHILRQIGINYMTHTLTADDMGWVAKLANPQFSQLWIGEYGRIKVTKCIQTIRKKLTFAKIIVI